MELEEQALRGEYTRETFLKTLELGQKLCKWGIPLALIITVIEAWVYKNTAFVLSRLLFIVPALAYYIFASLPCSKDKPKLALPLHLATITGALLMMLSLAFIKLNLNDIPPAYQIASVNGGLVVIIFIAYVFSAGVKKYVSYILTILVSLIFIYLYLDPTLTWRELTLFINPGVATLVIIILSIFDEQRSYQDFRYHKEIELHQLKLQHEIEERKVLEVKLQQQLKEDYLTGVYNRRVAFSLLDSYINDPQPFSLCYIDINNFKMVNDKYGHSQGDVLLIAFAEYLKVNIRKSDFLCRIGGDEFLVILPHCHPEEAQNIIERIRNSCIETTLVNDIRLDFSFGFYHYNLDKIINSYDLLEMADRNMYQRKATKY